MARQAAATLRMSTRRQLQVLEALARERLLDVHHRYALELVDRTRRELDPGRAFEIYARLHQLKGAESEQLFQRLLVAMGRRTPPRPFADEVAAEETPAEQPATVIGQIRRRLRGRENRELRAWVEFHTGRAETELLWTHVENAHGFVELLEPFVGISDAITIYTQQLEIQAPRAEIIYYLVLAHMSSGANPTTPEEAAGANRLTLIYPEGPAKPPRSAAQRLENRRGAGGNGR